MKAVVNTILGLFMGVLSAGLFYSVITPPRGEPIVLRPLPTPKLNAIHVSGAVLSPGVYHLPLGSRMSDAVQAAGGFLAFADRQTVNLAATVKDGDQVVIPQIQETNSSDKEKSGDKINLNSATLEELDSLPGIGPAIAQRIVDFRKENGPFKRIEDLNNVSGIGLSTFERIKDLITTGK